MAVLVRTLNKTLNTDALQESLRGLSFADVRGSVDLYGFEAVDARRIAPIAARKKVGVAANGVEDFADPGEIRFRTTRDLTAQEQAELDAVLAAHNAATLTPEQQREDQDEADLDALITAAQQFSAFLTAFDNAGNVTQLKAALRPFCVNVGRALRNIVRKQRSASL